MKPHNSTFPFAFFAFFTAAFIAACGGQKNDGPDPSQDVPPSVNGPVVVTTAGEVEGVKQGALNVFKGIPYATAARWEAPFAVEPWSQTKSAKEFGPACVQPTQTPSIYIYDLGATSEDCLSLNLWAPEAAAGAPVFIWIHGGALSSGSSKEPMYDGSKLAELGLIVVSINYRLGILGYLAHPELSETSSRGVSGNYGLLDQIAALRWVQENISEFGGNQNNVTIAGQSAGALSVMYLMAAPEAKGLFSKAIAQSGYMISMPELKLSRHGHASAEALGVDIANKLGASDLGVLRAMDAQQLVDLSTAMGFMPLGNVDGVTLPRQLVETFDFGEQAAVPILAGFNEGEVRSLPLLAPPVPLSPYEYRHTIESKYLDLSEEFLRIYPDSDMRESIYANTRDALYGWTAKRLVKNQTDIVGSSYLYFFDHGYPAAENAGLNSFHGSEIPYLFSTFEHTPLLWPKNPTTLAESNFSQSLMQYWSSFARDGTPIADESPGWPAFGAKENYMEFGSNPDVKETFFPGMFELQEETVCRKRASGNLQWNWNTGLSSPELISSVGCQD